MSLLKPYNPLVYPGNRRPGFDPNHVALSGLNAGAGMAAGHGFSGIAGNPGQVSFVNLLNGKPQSSTNGTPTAGVDGAIGPFVNFGPGGASDSLYFSGQNTAYNAAVGDNYVTIGLILVPTSVTGALIYFHNSSDNFGVWAGSTGGNVYTGLTAFGETPQSGITLSVNVPYFIGYSSFIQGAGGSTQLFNFVVKRLDTGAVQLAQATLAAAGSNPPRVSSGTYVVGAFSSAGNAGKAKIAAAMWSPSFLSQAQLRAWADDPWSFWYPSVQRDLLFRGLSTAAGGGTAYTISSDEGTYTLTGKAQTLNTSRSISSVQGVYTLTGKPQSSVHTQQMSLAQGSYSLVGEPQTLNKGLTVSLAQGSYTQTGQTTTPQVGMPATQGSYSLSGKATSFSTALSIRPVQGSYSLIGFPQVLTNTPVGSSGQVSGNKFIADVGQMTEKTY